MTREKSSHIQLEYADVNEKEGNVNRRRKTEGSKTAKPNLAWRTVTNPHHRISIQPFGNEEELMLIEMAKKEPWVEAVPFSSIIKASFDYCHYTNYYIV